MLINNFFHQKTLKIMELKYYRSMHSLYIQIQQNNIIMFPVEMQAKFISYEEVNQFMTNFSYMFQWQPGEMNFLQNYTWNQYPLPSPVQLQIEPIQKENTQVQQQVVIPNNERKRRHRDAQKEGQSAKKNGQSNIVNQFFSFFASRQKSFRIVLKVIRTLSKPEAANQKILTIFYHLIRLINVKRGRKYVNRVFLKKAFLQSTLSQMIPQITGKMEKVEQTNLKQMCMIFRRCVNYFLKKLCVSAVLTSKRITLLSKQEHLRKRRIVHTSVNLPIMRQKKCQQSLQ